MRERAVRFGKGTSLVGVVSEPDAPPSDARPAVLMLNSGILHHVGASRLHVQLGRRLADDGHLALRFDLSGIGDSEPRRDSLPFEQSAVLETREAMDHLAAQRGARSFVLFGLCSGADMAFRVAAADARVVGIVQLDAWAYRTPGFWARHYARRARDPKAWTGFVRRKLGALRPGLAGAPSAEERGPDLETPTYRRRFPPRDAVAEDLRALLGRGTELLHMFSGGQEEHYNHRGQYRRSFRDVDFAGRLRVEYIEAADHLFSALEHQRFVVATVAAWMRERFAGTAAAATAATAAPPALADRTARRSRATASPAGTAG